uniref:Uncharacterized protein n=1 Tax=Rhizophora mucronata TaxID=61149 RepID=A0A2P2NRG8_RHIMU
MSFRAIFGLQTYGSHSISQEEALLGKAEKFFINHEKELVTFTVVSSIIPVLLLKV